MPLDTDTQVDTVKRVRDENNDLDAPANESQQQQANTLLSTVKDRLTSIRDSVATESTLSTAVDRLTSIRDSTGNFSEVQAFEHSTNGTSAEALPSYSVPDGVAVVVQYGRGNSGSVYVGNGATQPATLDGLGKAVSFRVDDTADIYVRTPNSGDSVGVYFEQ
jgi:hypothetical protein